ncbi:MAG: NAD-dependent epimerase/dehydratase family protein [Bacteroidetes bacterium]|nr:NAD-dependent epimerase/dehydratase family protein [Bacteroidota bacterium]
MNNTLNSKGRVLVTGGTGFLGAYIIQELTGRGYSVRAIRRSDRLPAFMPPSAWEGVEWVSGDILDIVGLEEAAEGMDAIIHAAGKVSFATEDRRALFSINIDGTANIVNAALERQVPRLIHVSSIAALGRTGNGEKVDEEKKWTDTKWNTPYAISKFRGEIEVWRGIGEGLSAAIVNPSTLLGYGDWGTGSSALFRNAYDEFPWYTEGVNGFVDVADAARAIVALLESNISGQRYILNGDNWTFRRLFETMADAFGKKRPYKEATPFLGGIAWRQAKLKSIFTGRPTLLSKESAKIAQSKTYLDNSKVLRQLPGFQFTPLEDTIKRACAKYQTSK